MSTQFDNNAPGFKRSRVLYIIEAAVEYFISILMGTTYLARISLAIGMSDSQTAILTSLTSFAFTFQILALFIGNHHNTKSWVIPCHVANQLLFTFVYLVPVIELPAGIKPFLLIVPFIVGSLLHNMVQSPKMTWMMSFVAENDRGSFTAKKEIFSLISGMTFTYIMGAIIDYFDEIGDTNGSFITCGITVFGLMVIHTLLLIFTKSNKPVHVKEHVSIMKQVKGVLTDKSILIVIPVSLLYYIGSAISNPFYSTYQLNELGFNMSYVAILAAISSISRALVSLPLGKFADKFSFTKMLTLCYGVKVLSYFVNIFTTPENGMVMYAIYTCLAGIALGGVSSGLTNLIFDHTPVEKRTGALAVQNTLCGLVSFFTTLSVTPLVDFIQSSGNSLFGLGVYAQQVLSAMSMVVFIIVIIYLNTVVKYCAKPYRQ